MDIQLFIGGLYVRFDIKESCFMELRALIHRCVEKG